MDPHERYRSLLGDPRAARGDSRGVLDRAAGLLAGRVGCPVREAYGHLLRIAEEQGRDPAEVAAETLDILDAPASPDEVRDAVEDVLRRPPAPAEPDEWPEGAGPVQELLDGLPGGYSWVLPVRDDAGTVVDFVVEAVSPDASDVTGRSGAQLVGLRVSETYPGVKDGPIWAANLRVLDDGKPRELPAYRHVELGDGTASETLYALRISRLGPGLLVSWVPQDETRLAERIAQTERLGNLGWGQWDLVSGQVTWSDGLYRVYERDRADGPLPTDEANALVLPEDQPLLAPARAALAAGERADITYRIWLDGRVKHLRTVVDAVRDAAGRTLKVYGIVQDVTARETARQRLVDIERQLLEHQRTLAHEHRMAVQLQQIILPIPEEPVDIRGLRVAVRYLPAERANRVGGDWFHAAEAPGGGVLLAIGDVAGHGIQAATTMAQLRHALVALAVTTTTDPAELLGHLNRLLCAGGTPVDTATAVIAYYDPADRTLTWAQAGHPPPLRTRAGSTDELPRPRGPLLGVLPDAEYQRASTPFEPGDLLLLYTDGLVENRQQQMSVGLAPVLARLNQISGSTRPLADLIADLHRANPDDDTCILAARPVDSAETVPATRRPDWSGIELLRRDFDRSSLGALRHEIARHCAGAGLDETSGYWFVVACNEITTNAVRHGGGSGRASLWVDGQWLHCRIVDRGTGIPAERQRRLDVRPAPDTIGGRGLWLARQGCESMIVDASPTGSRITLSTRLAGNCRTPAAG